MRVILLEDVKNLGKKYEVKDVSSGYAKNYLFPNKLAIIASQQNLAKIKNLKSKLLEEEKKLIKHLEEVKRLIEDRYIEFNLKTDDKGSVFGSVNKEAILKALREHKLITKERIDILLDHPIKEFGEHQIKIDLKKGIIANLKIKVLPQK